MGAVSALSHTRAGRRRKDLELEDGRVPPRHHHDFHSRSGPIYRETPEVAVVALPLLNQEEECPTDRAFGSPPVASMASRSADSFLAQFAGGRIVATPLLADTPPVVQMPTERLIRRLLPEFSPYGTDVTCQIVHFVGFGASHLAYAWPVSAIYPSLPGRYPLVETVSGFNGAPVGCCVGFSVPGATKPSEGALPLQAAPLGSD